MHIDNLRKKVRRLMPIFYKFRKFMSVGNMMKIYYANFHSIIAYCLLIYGRSNKTRLMKLEILQRRILKIIFRTNSANVSKFIEKHKILEIRNLYKYKLLCLAHDTVFRKNHQPVFLQDQYKCKDNMQLRNKKTLS